MAVDARSGAPLLILVQVQAGPPNLASQKTSERRAFQELFVECPCSMVRGSSAQHTTTMTALIVTEPPAPVPCPRCRSAMTSVAVTPHLVVPDMERHTFVCYACNETRTYMLPTTALAK
jgi:hypothetical protein